jgi:hypothetical protein
VGFQFKTAAWFSSANPGVRKQNVGRFWLAS